MRELLHITLSTFNRRIRCKGIPLWASDHLLNELLHPVFFDGTNEKQVEVNTDWSFSRSLCAVLWERLGGKSVRLCSTAKPLQQEPQSELQVSAALIPVSPRAAGGRTPRHVLSSGVCTGFVLPLTGKRCLGAEPWQIYTALLQRSFPPSGMSRRYQLEAHSSAVKLPEESAAWLQPWATSGRRPS